MVNTEDHCSGDMASSILISLAVLADIPHMSAPRQARNLVWINQDEREGWPLPLFVGLQHVEDARAA